MWRGTLSGKAKLLSCPYPHLVSCVREGWTQVGNPICRQIPWGEGRQYEEHLAVRRGIRPTFNPKLLILN